MPCGASVGENMKKPGEDEPEPPGGRAARRLEEFLAQRLPQDPDALPEIPGERGDEPAAGGPKEPSPE